MSNPSPSDFVQAAQDHQRAGRLDQAEAACRRVIELDADHAAARLHLGVVLLDSGRAEEATEILSQLVLDHPKFAAAWVQLARTIIPHGFDWEAHQAINKALKADPDTQTLVTASQLLLTLKHIKAAESASRRAVAMTPDHVPAWIQLGQTLVVKGQPRDAAAAYMRALSHEPHNTMAAFYLAALAGDDHNAKAPNVAVAPPQYVRALFDDYAERFDDRLVITLKYRVPQMLEQMLETHLSRCAVTTTLNMLDAGCGTGLCGPWLSRFRGRLNGIDLSTNMLARARERNVYDDLINGEVVDELCKRPAAHDLIVAADLLVYIGDLRPLFAAAATSLRNGGILMLSAESTPRGDFQLLPTHRFAHSLEYLERLTAANGLTVRATQDATLRHEKGDPVHGWLLLAEK